MKPDKELAAGAEEVEVEPCELFVGIGILIIEGRTPGIGPRGYGEGPHCATLSSAHTAACKAHACNTHDWQCVQQENFRRHMLLLWQNNIPMSIEVLLCPDCCCHSTENRVQVQAGDAAEPATATTTTTTTTANSESNCILLEQWTVTMSPKKSAEALITTRTLLQAIRSYLHFSQLSAWYSLTCGKMPRNIVYRVCVPGEVFSNKFSHTPDVHSFPLANVGWNNSLNVCVKALPRSSPLPPAVCKLHSAASSCSPSTDEAAASGSSSSSSSSSTSSSSEGQQQQQQQKATSVLMGDGLLDPPQLLEKFPSKRYQSPSRCGSPASSVETPEHWMFGGNRGRPCTPHDRGRPWRRSEYASPPNRRGHQSGCCSSASGGHDPSAEKSSSSSPVPSTSSASPSCALWCPKSQRRDYEACSVDLRGKMTPPNMTPEETMEILQTMRPRTSSFNSQCNVKFGDGSAGKTQWAFAGKTSRMATDEAMGATCPLPTPPPPPPPSWDLFAGCESKLDQATSSEEYGPQCKQRKAAGDVFATCFNWRMLREDGGGMQKTCVERATTNGGDFMWRCRDSKDVYSKHPDCDYATPARFFDVHQDSLNANVTATATATEKQAQDLDNGVLEGNNNWNWNGACNGNGADIVSGAFDLSKVLNRETSLLMTLFKKTAIQNEENAGGAQADVAAAQKREVPSADDKAKFRRSLDSATNLVFHNKTGLPLTSSPAPLRKGTRFDFDSSLTSVAAIRHALFEQDHEMEEEDERLYGQLSNSAPPYVTNSNLLGNFEESVLNGRLEPVSTVQGFTAEIGASGTFCPKHQTLPVTVFFYSLSEVEKLSTPYMGHINIGKVGYHIPKKGTIQVTLFNPHGTVVKMFVVVYDLCDMPPRCQTFLRQRTLYMPVGSSPDDLESQKWLRYLIHLRIASSKSGRIYLHTDIRMVIFRKSDMDAATIHGKGAYELRSFTKGPVNPKFSPKR